MTADAKPQYSVLIAEDQELFGENLRIGLQRSGLCNEIRLVRNGQQAVEAVEDQEPDLMLIDMRMPEMDGIAAAHQVKERYPDIKIIMLTSVDEADDVRQALSAGVDGYSSKEISLPQLIRIIQMVMHGALWMGPRIAQQVLREMMGRKPSGKAPHPAPRHTRTILDEREIQILTLVADYKTNLEIADELGISEAWIDGYIRNIVDKMSVGNEAEAIRKAVDDGVLSCPINWGYGTFKGK